VQYRLNAIDVDKFKRDITDSTILHPFSGSVDELANAYNNGLHSLVDKHAPLCTKRIVLRLSCPWYANLRRKLERKWRYSKLAIDHQMYREQCAITNKLLQQTRISYYSEKIKSCGHDQKSIYRLSKHLMGNGVGRTLTSGVPAKELAQCFSDFFIKKVDNIRSDLQPKQIEMSENVPELPTAMSEVLAYNKLATPEEVRSVIRKAADKSSELDPIPTWLLKQCLNEPIPLVTAIINRSMETGSMPM